jgi:hypothetical protein
MHGSQNIKENIKNSAGTIWHVSDQLHFPATVLRGKEIPIPRISSVSPTARLRSQINGKENRHSSN